MKNIIEITFENGDQIAYELRGKDAPEACKLLVKAVENGLLNNMKVERIVPDFVFQPWYDETKRDERYNIEIPNSPNGIPFKRGSIGLAGDGDKVAVPACIFIALSKNERLTRNFMNIGQVIKGMEILDKIEKLPLVKIENPDGVLIFKPKDPLIISSVKVLDTKNS